MTGIIILAAGSSSRLGRPKQNLLFSGKTLLQHTIDTAFDTVFRPIVVVLGANKEKIETSSQNTGITIVYNPDWAEGMASSIRIGIATIQQHQIDHVIIMLCDQPFVNSELVNALVEKQLQTDKPIIACSYNETVGVPVLFCRLLFDELLQLKGHNGAKKVLKFHPKDIATIPFEKGDIDIDTPEDYEALIQ
jgi:molybdenum cofactor cytidylyltransferase